MKRILVCLVALLMIGAALLSCQNQTKDPEEPSHPSEPSDPIKPSNPEDQRAAPEVLLEYFQKQVKENPDASLEKLQDLFLQPWLSGQELTAVTQPYFEGYSIPVVGLSEGAKLPAYVNLSWMLREKSDPFFEAYLFEVATEDDAKSFAEAISASMDSAQLEAAGATEYAAGQEGKYVFLAVCTEEIKNVAIPEQQRRVLSLMRQLNVYAELRMGVSCLRMADERAPYYTGVENHRDLAEEFAALCEPDMGVFSMVLVEVKKEADAKTVAEEMDSNLDPNRWVCMSAEYKTVVTNGRYVLGIMGSRNDCERIVRIFGELLQGKAS